MWILAIQTTEADSLILIMMINWIFRGHAGICTSKLLPRLCLAQQQFPHQHRTKQRTGPLCWVPCHHHHSRGWFPGDQMVQPLCVPARRWMQVFSFSMIASLQRLSTQWGQIYTILDPFPLKKIEYPYIRVLHMFHVWKASTKKTYSGPTLYKFAISHDI